MLFINATKRYDAKNWGDLLSVLKLEEKGCTLVQISSICFQTQNSSGDLSDPHSISENFRFA